VLTGIAGLTLLLHGGGGLYWLIPAVLAGLIGPPDISGDLPGPVP
jgi:hypothetical protein